MGLLFLADPELRQALQEIQKSGTPLLLTNSERHVLGAVVPDGNPLLRFAENRIQNPQLKKPALIITPDTDIFTVRHEFQHLEDGIALGRKNELRDGLKSLGKKYEKSIDNPTKAMGAVYRMLSEQSAYGRELTELESFRQANRSVFTKDGLGNINFVSVSSIFSTTRDSKVKYFSETYAAPVSRILAALKPRNPEAYRELVTFIGEQFRFREQLAPKLVLPDHF